MADNVELLIERVNNLLDNFDELKAEVKANNATINKVPILESRLEQQSQTLGRAFAAIEAVNTVTKAHGEQHTAQRTANKIVYAIVGVGLGVSTSFTGWAWGQLQSLRDTDMNYGIRINTLEVKNSEAEKNRSKFEEKGWVRK